jgi:ABC-type transport system substrate-binding protein
MLNLIKDDLAKVGIDMVPASVEFNTLVNNVRQDLDYEAALLGIQAGVPPDSPGMGQNTWRSRGVTHYWNAKQKHPETPTESRIDALMDQNIGTLDPALQKSTWLEMQNLLNESCYFIWLPTQIMRLPVRNRFGNLMPSNMPHRLLWNIETVFARPAHGRR